jgi:hypothetical protein
MGKIPSGENQEAGLKKEEQFSLPLRSHFLPQLF